MKCLFMGTPDFAVPALQATVDAGFDVVAVMCQPDRPKGRGRTLQAPPVKELALQLGLPVLQPENLREKEIQEQILHLNANIGIVVAYGLMIPDVILNALPLGCVNIHPSLLPLYRGPSPLQAAIAHGDAETGVSIMQVTSCMDAGPVYRQTREILDSQKTYGDLHDEYAVKGARELVCVLQTFQTEGHCASQEQNEAEATYCKKITSEDCHIDWSQSAKHIQSHIHSVSPSPGASTMYKNMTLKVLRCDVFLEKNSLETPGTVVALHKKQGLELATGKGTLLITELQLQGSRVMTGQDFINGKGAQALGEILG